MRATACRLASSHPSVGYHRPDGRERSRRPCRLEGLVTHGLGGYSCSHGHVPKPSAPVGLIADHRRHGSRSGGGLAHGPVRTDDTDIRTSCQCASTAARVVGQSGTRQQWSEAGTNTCVARPPPRSTAAEASTTHTHGDVWSVDGGDVAQSGLMSTQPMRSCGSISRSHAASPHTTMTRAGFSVVGNPRTCPVQASGRFRR